jgi:hypothetical protein
MVTGGASSSSTGDGAGLEEMMKDLGLKEEDLDDVNFEDEVQPTEEDTRWMVTARVFTEGEYSSFWFFNLQE